MSDPAELVQYLVFREDLCLPRGKIAAQAGHAVLGAVRAVERSGDARALADLRAWENGNQAKVALRVADGTALAELGAGLRAAGVIFELVIDDGRTVVAPGTATVIALAPMARVAVAVHVGALRLL